MGKKILYITYDGLQDPLGQSQILPYILKLAKNYTYDYTVISFEKKKSSEETDHIKNLLKSQQIDWHPLLYTKRPPILSTIWDIFVMLRKIKKLVMQTSFDWVHCRSYIAAFGGAYLQKNHQTKFLFDIRGFWADERLESGLWRRKHLLYYGIYLYFKHKEKHWLRTATHIVTLTKKSLQSSILTPFVHKTTVIPCMADADFFDPARIDRTAPTKWRKLLNIPEGTFVLGYLGSVSSWYLVEEMIVFFKKIRQLRPDSLLLWVTPEMGYIREQCLKNGLSEEYFRTLHAKRDEVPAVCKLFSAAVCFIMPTFSKTASSPVKIGELMLMGIQVVCNPIGDLEALYESSHGLHLVRSFDTQSLEKVAAEVCNSSISETHIINTAKSYFSLSQGVALYHEIYAQ